MTDLPPLDRPTPAVAAEVRRSLLLAGGVLAAIYAAFALVLGPLMPAEVAVQVLGYLALYLAVVGAVSVAAAYLSGGWVGMLRTSFVVRTWGVDPEALSAAGQRRRVGNGGYWLAIARGAAVGAVAVAAVLGLLWAATGRPPTPGGGWAMGVVGPMLASGRAWLVRRAVAEKLAGSPAPAVP